MEIVCISWEDVIESIAFLDPSGGQEFDSFYNKCLHYNRPQAVTMLHDLRSGPAPEPEPDLAGLDDQPVPARLSNAWPVHRDEPRDPIRDAAIRRKG